MAGTSRYYVGDEDLGNRAFLYNAADLSNLGTLGNEPNGYGQSEARAVNNAGEVVGDSYNYIDGVRAGYRAFLYNGSEILNLGSFGVDTSGLGQSNAVDINNSGQVAGHSALYEDGNPKGWRAFRYDGAGLVSLGVLGTDPSGRGNSLASDINDVGQVIGYSSYYVGSQFKGNRAFLYDGNTLINLGAFGKSPSGEAWSYAEAVNNSGQVIGNSSYYVAGVQQGWRAFLYDHGALFNLGFLGSVPNYGSIISNAVAINDTGQITGYSTYYEMGTYKGGRGFLYEHGVLNSLGTLSTDASGYGNSIPTALNNAGQIVGRYERFLLGETVGDRPFLYDQGTMFDLNDLIPPATGWVLLSATDINEAGQIAGTGTYNGVTMAFRLDPVIQVPEPTVLALLGIGLASIGVGRRPPPSTACRRGLW